jgi:hypothetical protein
MKYYKNSSGDVYAFESDGSQDAYIPAGTVPMTPEEVQSHIAPAPKPAKTQFAPLEFLDRFTEAEQLATATAAMSNPIINLWYYRMMAATYVDLIDPRVEAGIDALIAAGLLAPSRKEALMSPEAE